MKRYPEDAWERAVAKKITSWHAAEINAIWDRSMRQWRGRYEQYGYDPSADGFDRRRGPGLGASYAGLALLRPEARTGIESLIHGVIESLGHHGNEAMAQPPHGPKTPWPDDSMAQ